MSGNCGAGCSTVVNEGINCEICKKLFHPKCAGMSVAVIRAVIQLTYFNWFCNSCGEKYGSAAAKAAASESTLSDQLTELRVMVADCSAKVDEVKLVVKSETATMQMKKRPKPVHRNMHFPVVEADG